MIILYLVGAAIFALLLLSILAIAAITIQGKMTGGASIKQAMKELFNELL